MHFVQRRMRRVCKGHLQNVMIDDASNIFRKLIRLKIIENRQLLFVGNKK